MKMMRGNLATIENTGVICRRLIDTICEPTFVFSYPPRPAWLMGNASGLTTADTAVVNRIEAETSWRTGA